MKNVFLSLKIVFVFANSIDPDEMLHCVACGISSGYLFTVCQRTHLGVIQRVKVRILLRLFRDKSISI